MVNECFNHLEVAGPAKEVRKFFKQNREDEYHPLLFNKSVPVTNGHEECRERWGVSGEPRTHTLTESYFDAKFPFARYQFYTAWTPPLQWVKTVAGKYPQLIIHLAYCETGCGFMGILTCKDHVTIRQDEYSYDKDGWKELCDDIKYYSYRQWAQTNGKELDENQRNIK